MFFKQYMLSCLRAALHLTWIWSWSYLISSKHGAMNVKTLILLPKYQLCYFQLILGFPYDELQPPARVGVPPSQVCDWYQRTFTTATSQRTKALSETCCCVLKEVRPVTQWSSIPSSPCPCLLRPSDSETELAQCRPHLYYWYLRGHTGTHTEHCYGAWR